MYKAKQYSNKYKFNNRSMQRHVLLLMIQRSYNLKIHNTLKTITGGENNKENTG